MENISKKPVRGRPVKYPPDCLAELAKIYPHHSRRGLVEVLLRCSAIATLKDAAKIDPQMNAWVGYFFRRQEIVLAALGRIELEEDLLEVAKHIATRRLRPAEAIQLIRSFRRHFEADAEAPPDAGEKNPGIAAECA